MIDQEKNKLSAECNQVSTNLSVAKVPVTKGLNCIDPIG